MVAFICGFKGSAQGDAQMVTDIDREVDTNIFLYMIIGHVSGDK